MNQWAFVWAAYGVAVIAVVALLIWALLTMRRWEAAADELRRR